MKKKHKHWTVFLVAVLIFCILPQSAYADVIYNSATNPVATAGATTDDGDYRFIINIDYDSDGDQDFIGYDGASYDFYENNGSGSFTKVAPDVTLPIKNGAEYLIADFDNDGDEDIFAPGGYFVNNGTGTFASATNPVATAGATTDDGDYRFIINIDYDSDGDQDFIGYDGDSYDFYENNGSGVFTKVAPNVTLPITNAAEYLIADFDNDGDEDIFAPGGYFVNNGTGTFASATNPVATAGATTDDGSYRFISNIDHDSDGDQDFVGYDGDSYDFYENNGSGFFTKIAPAVTLPIKNAAQYLIADFDNDGDQDIFAPQGYFLQNGTVGGTNNRPPRISTMNPADGDAEFTGSSNITLTFDEPIATAGYGTVKIFKTSDDSLVESIPGNDARITGTGSATISINPTTTLSDNTAYYIQINKGTFYDADGMTFMGIANKTTYNFMTGEVTPLLGNHTAEASANTLSPEAGENNTITLTVKDSLGNIDTDFDGAKNVKITGVEAAPDGTYGSFNGIALDANSAGEGQVISVTFADGVATPNLKLNKAVSQTIGFSIDTVTTAQTNTLTIEPTHGIAASMSVTQDITEPTSNGGQFAQQPSIMLKDAYGNICTSNNTTVVTAAKEDVGTWTLTGTTIATASSGVATFANLGAINTALVNNAQLGFTATGLADVTSATVTLPAPADVAPTATMQPITGTLQVGETLTGHYTYGDVNGDLQGTSTFKWCRADDASGLNKSEIAGATSLTYTLQSADAGKYISFEVTPVAQAGTSPGTAVESEKVGPIVGDTTAPTGYSVAIDQTAINNSNKTAMPFTFSGAEVGATYNYMVSSSGGAGTLTGSGTVTNATQQITGIDISSLSDGTLTLSVTLTDTTGNSGTAATDTVMKDTTAPTGYSVGIDQTSINNSNKTAMSFTFGGAEVGATYNYVVSSSGGGSVTGSGTVTNATQQITGIDVSALGDGTITLSVTLTDTTGNSGTVATDTVMKDTIVEEAPTATMEAVTGTLQEGETLTGHYTYGDVNGDLQGTSTFKWYRADDATGLNKSVIAGATSLTYTLQSADIGKYISFEVTPVALTGTTQGTAVESTKVGSIAVAADITAPALTKVEVNRTGDTIGIVKFNSSEAGSYYYEVVADGEVEPVIDTNGAGTTFITSEITITNPIGLTIGAKDIYIKVKDSANNVSIALKIDIDAYISVSSDATLKTTSTVKGETVTSLGTPSATLGSETAGTVTITAAKAADTSNGTTFVTLFEKNETQATVKAVKYSNGTTDFSGFEGATAYTNATITDGDFFIVKVTAEDVATVNYYRVNVTVTSAPSTAKAITAFNFNELTPAVTGTVDEVAKTIALTVPHGTDVTALVPTITHTGTSVFPNTGVAQNFTTPVTYTVTFTDSSTQDYTATVSIGASSNSNLSALSLSSGTLSPAFASGTTSYTASVGNADSSITVTPTVADGNATVEVNGLTATSGSATGGINLSVGNNIITVVVTAQDGTTSNTYIITVTRAASSGGSGGSSGGSSSTTTTQPSQSTSQNTVVVVNGKEQNAGKESQTTEGGKSTVTVAVDSKAVESKIEEAIKTNTTGLGNVIQVPVADTKSEVAKVELTGDIVKKLEENAFDVSVKRDNVEYVIPAEEFTISKVAENLGIQEKALSEIKVEVKITKLDEKVVEKYKEVAKANGAELVFPPVQFEITANTTNVDGTIKEHSINKFSNYVERVMEIPVGVDPSKITTGIVFNADGTYSHVPTEVYENGGKWYAKLNSLTNSDYSIIWNPVTVKSVENHWAKDAVNDMASRLVIFNAESFEPDKAITRADFAEYIVRALGLYREGSSHENNFKDVSATGERTLAILIANEYGIVSGYADGTFRGDNQITREEAMAMYQRAMAITKLVGSDENRYQNYTDYSQVSDWANSCVKEVLSAHVFNGTKETKISPKASLTYAEAAQAIRNLLVESKLISE